MSSIQTGCLVKGDHLTGLLVLENLAKLFHAKKEDLVELLQGAAEKAIN